MRIIFVSCSPNALLIRCFMTVHVDDPATFENAPVCLQLVGRTLEEEAVTKMTEVVDGLLKQSSK